MTFVDPSSSLNQILLHKERGEGLEILGSSDAMLFCEKASISSPSMTGREEIVKGDEGALFR